MGDFALNVISSLVASGALTAGLIFLARNWISIRLKQSIEHEYSQKLETYKHTLKADHEIAVEKLKASNSQDSAIRTAATTSFSEGHKAAHEKRLQAIETTWKAIIYIRSNTPDAVNKLDILVSTEFQEFLTNASLKKSLDELDYESLVSSMFAKQVDEVEIIRPFIGEYIYSLFYTYRAITGRVAYVLISGRDAGVINIWYKDAGVRQLISAFMTKEESDYFDKVDCGKFSWLRSLIEQKMLAQMNRIISGVESGNLALEQAHNIYEAATNLCRN